MENEAQHRNFMQMAIDKAKEGRYAAQGGAFGAVIVQDEELICCVHNRVKKEDDLTQHAELYAIQLASKKLGRDRLKECRLYTSCEPCMMCLGACHWADFEAIYFGASAEDAKSHGYIYSDCYYGLGEAQRHKEFRMIQLMREEAIAIWN